MNTEVITSVFKVKHGAYPIGHDIPLNVTSSEDGVLSTPRVIPRDTSEVVAYPV